MQKRIRTFVSPAMQALSLFAALMIVLVWLGVFHNLNVRRQAATATATQNTSNLSRVFEEHIARSIKEVDKNLLFLRAAYERDPQHFALSQWVNGPEFRSDLNVQFAHIATDGMMVSSNVGPADQKVDLSDREHFRFHVGKATDELFISKPVLGRVSKQWSIQLTRKLRNRDGSFAGVLVGSINPHHFTRFYEGIDVGHNGAVTLLGFDGIIRARGGSGADTLGQSAASSEVFKLYKSKPAGILIGAGAVDGVRRLLAYRVVDGFPLIVIVGMAEDEIYAEYQQNRRSYYFLGACLTALMLGVLMLGILQKLRLDATMRALASERDKADAANKAKSTFLAMMSHEIRTPMNAILGLSSSLLERPLEAQDRDLVASINTEGGNLLEILNDILDYSKLEAGKLQLENISFSPAKVVDSVIHIVEPRATAKGLQLSDSVDAKLPPAASGDGGRIRQVLLNLLTNAIKFTPAGSVAVETRCLETTNELVTIEWRVTDTGIGIAQDRIAGLFSDFVQADASINRRFGGSGLGLAICKRIINQMGGEIEIQSEIGKGTVASFRVTLPIAKAIAVPEREAAEPSRQLAAQISALQRPLRLLIVDDNPTNRLVASKMLQKLDVQINTACDGVEAVTAASKFAYDLILMDMRMPEMDGLEATRAIRGGTGRSSRVPIIAFTANAFPEDIRACSEAGMDDFVVKPVRKPVLFEVISRVLFRSIGSRVLPNRGDAQVMAAMPAKAETADLPLNGPIFDDAKLADLLREVGAEAADEVIGSLVQETKERLANLRTLSPASGLDVVTREAHSIKGLAGTFGFQRLAAIAGWLERNAKGLSAERYDAVVSHIEAAFEQAETQMRKPAEMAA